MDEMIGKMYGRWKVIERVENRNGRICYKCECQCQDKIVKSVFKENLVTGKSLSCGCLCRERVSQAKKQYNQYDLTGEFGIGYTSNGDEFYFDLEDYDKIKNYCWHLDKAGYVIACVTIEGKHTTIKMHRIIMGVTDPKQQVDHIKHHTNDNRKSKLRIVTNTENAHNKRKLDSNTSGVTGVCYYNKKWYSRIWVNNKIIRLGTYEKFEDAVKARKEAEEKYYGKYSYDNSMSMGEDNEDDDLF